MNVMYVIYEVSSGKISHFYNGPEPDLQLKTGQAHILAPYGFDTNRFIVQNQQLVEVPVPTEEITAKFQKDFKEQRDALLKQSDLWMLEDYPRGSVTLDQIKTYRQKLRDLPDNIGDINSLDDVQWPEIPTGG